MIVLHFFYGRRINESAVSEIAIAIAAMCVAGTSMARFAISGAQTLFGVCFGHNNIGFVLYRFMC